MLLLENLYQSHTETQTRWNSMKLPISEGCDELSWSWKIYIVSQLHLRCGQEEGEHSQCQRYRFSSLNVSGSGLVPWKELIVIPYCLVSYSGFPVYLQFIWLVLYTIIKLKQIIVSVVSGNIYSEHQNCTKTSKVSGFGSTRVVAQSLFCIFITVLGLYLWQKRTFS